MRTQIPITLYCLLVLCSVAMFGCGKKVDENKSISDVKAEADNMTVKELRSMAMKYRDAIVAKSGEVEKFTAKLKEIPITEKLGTEAKELTAEIQSLDKSTRALKERFEVYYQKLKEQGGDLSGLEL